MENSNQTGLPRFYNTSRWQAIRYHYKAGNPLCKSCQSKGITTIATQVDHIIPISEGGDPTSWENLQGLCDTCHSRKTRQENAPEKKPVEQLLSFGDTDVSTTNEVPLNVKKRANNKKKNKAQQYRGGDSEFFNVLPHTVGCRDSRLRAK